MSAFAGQRRVPGLRRSEVVRLAARSRQRWNDLARARHRRGVGREPGVAVKITSTNASRTAQPLRARAPSRPQPDHRRPLTTGSNTEQLRAHFGIAKQNGLTETELKEAIIHLAFYAGWPKAMSAITVAKEVFND